MFVYTCNDRTWVWKAKQKIKLNDLSKIQLRIQNDKKHKIEREREKMSIQEKPFAEQVYPCYNLWGKIHQSNGPPSKRSAPQY